MMKTPYFLIKQAELQQNIEAFRTALGDLWPHSCFSYSVKTNSLPWLLEYLKKEQLFAEVVSDEEYQLAKLCGYSDESIVFNGPIKSEQQLAEALDKGAYVNIDSIHEFEVVCGHTCPYPSRIGIRLNVAPELFPHDDIGYQEDGFRFGFSEQKGVLGHVINTLHAKFGHKRFGLHLHCNSVTRSVAVYRTIAQYAAYVIQKYGLEPSYIDIGGGFFGGVEGKPTASQYISTIRDTLAPVVDVNQTRLIIEPGSAIIGSVVELHTSVLDVKETSHVRMVTTDGSRVHLDPLWKRSGYKYQLSTQAASYEGKQVICGYTCMDHDRIMILQGAPELSSGDKIVYERVGAYSLTFSPLFIRYFPECYVLRDNALICVRRRISPTEYYQINSI